MDETKNKDVSPVSKTCLNCKRDIRPEEPMRRGLCQSCYQAAHAAIKAGELTWALLEKNGLALPRTKGGRPKARQQGTPIDQLIQAARARKPIGKGEGAKIFEDSLKRGLPPPPPNKRSKK